MYAARKVPRSVRVVLAVAGLTLAATLGCALGTRIPVAQPEPPPVSTVAADALAACLTQLEARAAEPFAGTPWEEIARRGK